MSVPVEKLNSEQKIWYARLVIAAILADDEISPSEVEFLKQVIAIVKDPAEKKELMRQIGAKESPSLSKPEGVGKEIVAAVFVELILIMISDLDFATKEKVFLEEVSQLFSFDRSYFNELMEWGEEGLRWKDSQRYLITQSGEIDSFQVPLERLDSEQKYWYASVLISTIMLERVVDESEKQFLKAAISFVDKTYQRKLIGYVRNKMAPPLTKHPDIPDEILTLIFVEVMLIVIADENLSFKERGHLEQIADICGFSSALFDHAIEWCNKGISWKKNKNPLIARCKLDQNRKLASNDHGPLKQNPENNSILNRQLECFVCESNLKIESFHLKPHTQEPNRNIFGIVTYLESLGDNDYIDYNMVKVIVCPTCFFASIDKELFRKNDTDPMPKALCHPSFKKIWLEGVEQRQTLFKKNTRELSTINRSIPTVIKLYQLAILTAQTLGKVTKDQSHQWQAVTLSLTLAEILMSNGNEKKADECLNKAKQMANYLFKNASGNLISIRSARLLFFIGLYQNDVRFAGSFFDFLRNLQLTGTDTLDPKELIVLKKVYGETKNALRDRSDYKKEKLFGFHLEI